MSTDLSLSFSTEGVYDPVATLSMLALGRGDPCWRVDGERVRLAISGPQGPLTVELYRRADTIGVKAFGPEAAWLVPFIPSLMGIHFRPPVLEGPRELRALAKQFAGFRLPRVPVVFPLLVRVVLQQLVSRRDAANGWRQLVRRHGRTIPGQDDLLAAPTAEVLSRMAPYQFVECGILPEQGRRIIGLARLAKRIEATWGGGMDPSAADRTCELLARLYGVGPWTTGYLRGAGLGDSDAVVLGDYSFPKRVAYFFRGIDGASDDDMLQILEPYRPHRFYVLSLILKGATPPPRRGPRRPLLRDRLPRRSQI